MNTPDFETELNRLYSLSSVPKDDVEFALRLERRLQVATYRRVAIMGTLGTVGAIGTGYWAQTMGFSSFWSATADLFFTALAETPFQAFVAIPLIVLAFRFHNRFGRY